VSHPIGALVDAYATLGLGGGDIVQVGEMGATPPSNQCTILTLYGVPPPPDIPVWIDAVQVAIYHRSLQTAFARAQAAFDALHTKAGWQLDSEWLAMGVFATGRPFGLGSVDAQGGRLYHVVLNLQVHLKRHTPPAEPEEE
jgi:hypothetical protein